MIQKQEGAIDDTSVRTDGWMDKHSDGQTVKPTYRDAGTRLDKTIFRKAKQ